jgi:hypothetical protein
MRDIRGDLEDRVDMVEQQISLENARFEQLILRLKTEQSNKLEHLWAQLRLTNKLLELMDWQQNVCVTLAARIAAAEEAEIEIWKSLRTGVGVAGAS